MRILLVFEPVEDVDPGVRYTGDMCWDGDCTSSLDDTSSTTVSYHFDGSNYNDMYLGGDDSDEDNNDNPH